MDAPNIINPGLKWNGEPLARSITTYIIVHHAAATATIQDVHQWHLSQGWRGIGYHYYIYKDGRIFQGRPHDTVGAHAEGYNYNSIGICFQGNFEEETPTNAQYKAGKDLVAWLRCLYPGVLLIRHRDVNATVCPGANFDLRKLIFDPEPEPAEDAHEWSAEPRAWAIASGIVTGDGTGYRWTQGATREEVVTMLHRMIKAQNTRKDD